MGVFGGRNGIFRVFRKFWWGGVMKETTKGFDVILVGQKHAQTYIIHNILEREREREGRER